MLFLIWAVLYIATTRFGSVLIMADEILTLASVVFASHIVIFGFSSWERVSERVFYIDYKYV